MAEQFHRPRREGNDLRHSDERQMHEGLDMEADIGGETMSDLEASAANRDRTVVTAAAERHGQPNGPCKTAGELSGDWRREIVQMRD